MKPKVFCSKCNAELTWLQGQCPSCGTSIDWPGSARKSQKSSPPGGSAFPARNVAILVAVIGGGVWLLETLMGPKTTPQPVPAQQAVQVPQSAPAGPDMSALPHIQELETQVKSQPENLDLRRELGNHLMDARFYDRAIAVYKEFLSKNPKNPDVRVDMGICFKELGDFAAASKEMNTALQYAPKHLYGHFNLGVVALAQGKLEEANTWFKKTVELDPKSDVGIRAQQLLQQHAALPQP